MINSSELVTALKRQVLDLEDDLRERLEVLPDKAQQWRDEHTRLVEAERTASAWVAWRDDRVTQAAVAWVLTTVFIRFCEDNGLVRPVWISGPADRRSDATDGQLAYFRSNPDDTDREWLATAIDYLATLPATAALVEEHSPLWSVSPSGQAITALLQFWRRTDDAGNLVFDFTDPQLSTRFLGDLYQDLSDHAKKTFALLQTPDFVEEFILDQTMEPALAERPLEGFSIIDPTCGSGHFLLGAFHRLLDRWARHAPAMEPQARVQQSLDAIHGVDINPFAVAIAQFRLTIAAMQACGLLSLDDAPRFRYHLASGDSLLFGRDEDRLFSEGDLGDVLSTAAYSSEDRTNLNEILRPGQYDVVVGNPPYITVKDKKLNAAYRRLYDSCHRKYALTAPFMERFFQLAKPRSGDFPPGRIGQITSNSFMKREFGEKLVQEFFPKIRLDLVADTSGAYIPGHGTPTVIIIGRNTRHATGTTRCILGIRGEPSRPSDPGNALVWSSIRNNIDRVGHEDQWITVAELQQQALYAHPWSLSGGAAAPLSESLESGTARLADMVESVGFGTITGEDEAYIFDRVAASLKRDTVPVRQFVEGDRVRDFRVNRPRVAVFPYVNTGSTMDLSRNRTFWPLRSTLSSGLAFGRTRTAMGKKWWEYILPNWPRLNAANLIAFAFVATHNHFVLDRGGKVFKQSAPVIKLPEGASEDDHLALLGVLNSSTACFWLKQNSHDKGNGGIGGGIASSEWERFYEFTGTTLQDFPLPPVLPLERGRSLDALAEQESAVEPEAVVADAVPTADLLSEAAAAAESLRGQMIAEQEELDWAVYGLYGLPGGDLVHDGETPELKLGERAFEIALASKVMAGDEETAWFERHGSTPITEIPRHWPDSYRDLVQRRLDLIASDPGVALLESPEHKRRWSTEPWAVRQDRALRGWLLDRLEDRALWFHGATPAPQSIGQLSDQVSRDAELISVLQLWEGRPDVPVVESLTKLMTDEAVPFLAAYRLKESGMRKRQAWEETWTLQRREDAGEDVGTIPVPPKYTSADFRKQSWWQARGKLDVPKERFILYPNAGRTTDPTPMLGWAGWDHAEQSLALSVIISAREDEGRPDDDLIPLVAGLAELQPWVAQWHAEVDPRFGQSMAVFCQEQLDNRCRQINQSIEQLAAWRPPAATRGRRKSAK